jgi:hypothetical protein
MENQRITEDQLSQKLVNARKVMSKVDSGNFEKGTVNQKIITSAPEELMAESTPANTRSTKPIGKIDPARIRESKLPDAIKQAMIDNPIPQIGLDSTLDMSFVEKTKELMEQDGQYSKPTQNTQSNSSGTTNLSASDLEKQLTPIIENIIRKTLDEIFDRKLQQILTAHETKTINEGLAIKVGDTIFTGKLTKAKSTK